MTSRSRVLAGTLLVALLAAGAALCIVFVPAGDVRVVAGSPPSVLDAGIHLRPPWSRGRPVDPGPRAVRVHSTELTDYLVFAADTVEVEVAFSASATVLTPGAWAERLAGPDPVRGVVLAALRPRLRAAAARYPSGALVADATGLARDLTGEHDGLRLDDVAVRVTVAEAGKSRLARSRAAAVGRRVLLVGVDSADWTLINPMLARGELPVLAGLIANGASGPLESIVPLLSPLIWTTIATGLTPEEHGVLDFVSTGPDGRQVPVGSTDRTAPALWNRLTDVGKTTSVVSWLATFPAEDIRGTIVTDRFGFLAFAGHIGQGELTPGMTWPIELMAEAARLRVAPEALSPDLLRRFVRVPPDSLRAALAPRFERGNLVNNLAHTLAAARSTQRIARWRWQEDRPDLGLFYFEMVDAVCHLYMPYMPPRLPWIDPADVQRYGGAVEAAYRWQDQLLGELVADADDSTLVVVVSDHGFLSGEGRPRGGSEFGDAGAARWHTRHGILVLHGPGVRAGHRIEGADVYDIAPTLLAYLGVAPPAVMRGRALRGAFTLELPESEAAPSGTTPPETTTANATEPQVASSWNNLGLTRMQNGDPNGAVEAFGRALALDPSLATAANNLALIHMEQGRLAEAEAVLVDVLERDPGYSVGWMNLGICRLRQGRAADAVGALTRASELEPRNAQLLRNLGFAMLQGGDPRGAAPVFTRSLELDDTAQGHFGLGMARLEAGDRTGARTELEAALERDPGHARAREVLGTLGAP